MNRKSDSIVDILFLLVALAFVVFCIMIFATRFKHCNVCDANNCPTADYCMFCGNTLNN